MAKQLVCLGVPLPPYIKEEGSRPTTKGRAMEEESY